MVLKAVGGMRSPQERGLAMKKRSLTSSEELEAFKTRRKQRIQERKSDREMEGQPGGVG